MSLEDNSGQNHPRNLQQTKHDKKDDQKIIPFLCCVCHRLQVLAERSLGRAGSNPSAKRTSARGACVRASGVLQSGDPTQSPSAGSRRETFQNQNKLPGLRETWEANSAWTHHTV